MAAKKTAIVQQKNDENSLPEHYAVSANVKQESKIPVDQFKAFTVFEEEISPVDENIPPKTESVNDEVDCSAMSTSYTSVRYVISLSAFRYLH